MAKARTFQGGDFGCRHFPHVVTLLEAIRQEGGSIDRVRNARHVKIYYRVSNGRKLIYATGLTPSDRHCVRNAVADVRCDLRRSA